MPALSFPYDEAVARTGDQLTSFLAAIEPLSDLDLLAPSLCRGWSRLEVVTHVRIGLEELATTTTRRVDGPADHDAASYWTSHPDDRDDDPVPHLLWMRRVASAYQRPSGAVAHLRTAIETARHAVRVLPDAVVDFQDKWMTSGDFLATWVVELAVHQLDLDLGDSPVGLDWARATLEALAGEPPPADLDDRTAVLAGLGRTRGPDLPASYPVSL